ncbi:MAG: DUF1553 domain-containing protein [Bryobacterales bacterium]|nr:DUF1553 domain-containing protein [Bryobacterales bacterium]
MLSLLCLLALPGVAAEPNLIDRYIDAKLAEAKAPMAERSSDAEFLRRVYLDLIGKLPDTATAKKFVADTDPEKRAKLVDSLFPPMPVSGMRSVKEAPFFDRWTYFFSDLFRNGQLLEEGINTFYDHIYRSLTLNVPYDEFVRDLITASATSTWADGAANFIARSHVFEGDGYQMNHEDTADEIAINTTKLFLGVNAECVSCHDGAQHLEKVNLWLSQRKRAELWRQASFFGKTFIDPSYGRFPHFQVKDTRKGYDLTTRSSLRPPRNKNADITPTFMLTGERALPGESPRQAYARMLTSHPQFARATVNLFWAELMGQGIVDPPFEFDLARQDPKNPPPAPWTIQPTHPELLDALAADFREHNHDLRRLMKMIVTSEAYQRSSKAPKGWKPDHDSLYARRLVRRMSAEQAWDSIADLVGVPQSIKVTFADKKATRVMQTRSPQDVEKADRGLIKVLQSFGQCDRYAIEANRKPSMVQSAVLMNDKTVRERLKIAKGSRLEALLRADPQKSNAEIVNELYYAALARPASDKERDLGVEVLREYREQGAEDLLWVLINRLDFLFY